MDEQLQTPPASETALPPHFTETPEFKAAVAAGASAAAEEILAKFVETQKASGSTSGGDKNWVEGLAMAIAELNDQGSKRKHVAPEVLLQRSKARDRMVELLIAARQENNIPVYHLRHKIYVDEQLVDPVWIAPDHTQRPTEIHWPGVPNEAMIPVNDVAKEIHAQFVESIGNMDREHQITSKPLFTTAGGLVVEGRPTPSRMARNDPSATLREMEPAGEGLRVAHRGMPGQFAKTNVLGTVAPPAMQTA